MKFKTGFSKLNEATNGGLASGGVWVLAGRSGCFKTGFGTTLAKDITLLNKMEDDGTSNRILFCRTEDHFESAMEGVLRIIVGKRNPEFAEPDFSAYYQKSFSNSWQMQTHVKDLVINHDELIKEIDKVEADQADAKVRVAVFDHLFLNTVNQATCWLVDELAGVCKERNILAIVPTTLQRVSGDIFESPEDFKKSIPGAAGIIVLTRIADDRHITLYLEVWNKETDTWTEFSIPFKEDPEYGLISDVTS